MFQQDSVIKLLTGEIKKKLGSHLKAIILFGSRARGDTDPTSDYDFLILVDACSQEIVNLLRQAEVGLIDTYGALSGSLIYSEEEWAARKNFPIGKNIEREGIVL